MNRRDFLHAAVFAGAVSTGAAHKAGAQAQMPRRDLRLVFSRGGELFASPGLDGTDARRVLSGVGGGIWAVSPDGRRIVWLSVANTNEPLGTVFVSDLLGRHQKQLLVPTDLRNRQGQKITRAGMNGAESLTIWTPVSLGWSADGRTVYFGCASAPPIEPTDGIKNGFKRATFAADAVNGTALVDSDGRWKMVVPLSGVDAQGGLLVGIDVPNPADQMDAAIGLGGPIALVNTAEGGTRTVLGRGKFVINSAQPYEMASSVALAPDHRSIAYISSLDKGLWLRDRWAASNTEPRKLALRSAGRPQWADNSKTIYYMVPVNGENSATVRDLYRLDVPVNSADVPTEPRLVLKNMDSFALAPL